MHRALAALVVFGCLFPAAASAQAPALTRPQRELLHAIVEAVDAADSQFETADVPWPIHIMRASDGSHYVAFSAQPPAAMLPKSPVMLYVRLDIVRPATTPAPRSPVREWLAGSLAAPPPPPRRGIAIGEMPVMGTTGNIQRGASTNSQPTTSGMVDIQLMELERRRAREQKEEAERRRRAELESAGPVSTETMPFEDFDLASRSVAPSGERVIARALTAGPGHYMLYAAWADPASPAPAGSIQVIKKRLILPPAPKDEFALSTVIVADGVRVREAPYPPSEQAAHPYAIGQTEVTPAADAAFRNDESLNVVFQVINPQPSNAGKPDVEILGRVVRTAGGRDEPVAAVAPLAYSAANLPAPFDTRQGHPLFAAMAVPLDSLRRGDYRLELLVRDKLASRVLSADVPFTVTATAGSLLKEAPPLAPAFAAPAIVEPPVRAYLATALRPAAPSAALRKALDTAASGTLVDLLVEEPVGKGEDGARAVLTGLAHLSIGDGSSATQLQRAVLLGAPIGPARLLSGAARALQNRDTDAILAWQEALKAGAPAAIIAPWLLDAYLRRGDMTRAAALVSETRPAPSAASWTRGRAAVLIASKQEAEAVSLLDTHLAKEPDDLAAQWLRLHALYTQVAAGNAAQRARFTAEAERYISAKGTYSDLAAEWLRALR